MSDERRPTSTPVLTLVVLVVTAGVSAVGLADHSVLHHLARRGGELADNEPWRLVTSLLVHDSWLALIANLVLLAIVGIAVERRHPRTEWIALYVVAGIVGQLVGLDWQPHGAGNSVAVFGLAGALVVDALRRSDPALLALGYASVVLVTLGAGDIGGAAGTVIIIVACVATGASVAATQRGTRVPPWAPVALATGALVLAAGLVALGDIHGPALLTGVVLATVWDAVATTTPGGGRTGRRRLRR